MLPPLPQPLQALQLPLPDREASISSTNSSRSGSRDARSLFDDKVDDEDNVDECGEGEDEEDKGEDEEEEEERGEKLERGESVGE